MLVIPWIHALVSTQTKQNQAGVVLNLDKRGEKAYARKTFKVYLDETMWQQWKRDGPDVIMRNFIAILQLQFPVDAPVP